MKVFSAILLEGTKTMFSLIECVPMTDLAIALKFAEDDIKTYFYDNMPTHKKKIIIDLIKELDQITIDDSIKMQHEIIASLNDIKKEGMCLN
ncbi:MAG TPA: FliG C-terminal domain-containing protein [Candidatus Cloacimonadota bacterium]|jgi:flagellar motor switch protein FliG|nr:FliG C-terminal domain-containing protein [Candidatus Cloacimonadales bacterium]HOQ80712.1 FliG C-terminal domain-containing protein [Candidatus Cloacimonadota bacterium]HPY95867.1 FliG C-terminal domain-containing protein [Candidatus Cloacimonadota bacterium]HQB41038.1 FliG C-terminal domain-containing protein [Candidatus Cloacimonadota bacterium]